MSICRPPALDSAGLVDRRTALGAGAADVAGKFVAASRAEAKGRHPPASQCGTAGGTAGQGAEETHGRKETEEAHEHPTLAGGEEHCAYHHPHGGKYEASHPGLPDRQQVSRVAESCAAPTAV